MGKKDKDNIITTSESAWEPIENWWPTTGLRYLYKDGHNRLQQLWQSDHGNHRWEDIPTVNVKDTKDEDQIVG